MTTTHNDAMREDSGIPSSAVVPSGPMSVLRFARGKNVAQSDRASSTPANCLRSDCVLECIDGIGFVQGHVSTKRKDMENETEE